MISYVIQIFAILRIIIVIFDVNKFLCVMRGLVMVVFMVLLLIFLHSNQRCNANLFQWLCF